MRIAIINGPNLNLLGLREPAVYGSHSFEEYFKTIQTTYPDIEFNYYHSNVEGELIDILQKVGFSHNGIILNPGGYTHTSVALGDTIAAITAPVIEVHISNIFNREEFRRLSYISAKAKGVISGLGLKGYLLAVSWFV